MRVLLLGDPRSWHCEKWRRAFLGQGWQVLWLGFEGPPLEGAETLSIPGPKPLKYLLGAFFVYLKARRFKPQLVNAHMITGYGLVGALLKRRGTKLLLSAWGPDLLESIRKPLQRLAVRLALKRADLVQTDADVMDEILRNFDFPPEKIVQIPYGLDDELLEEPLPEKPKAPPWVLLSHRRLDPLYNPGVILEAAAILKRRGYKAVELVFSSGGSLEEDLRRRAWELGVKTEITGFIPRKALLQNIRRAHFFISAALSDSTPVSLLEAMALGAVPVVSDLPALAQWVTHGLNGLLFNPQDPEELAHWLEWAFERPEFVRRAREINKRLVRERGSWRRGFQEVVNALR